MTDTANSYDDHDDVILIIRGNHIEFIDNWRYERERMLDYEEMLREDSHALGFGD
jgi:hypothetical protein